MASKHTVLIVDDIRLNIDLLTGILCDDYNIKSAPSGESALRLMDTEKPDIVLLDISMPGIDGFEVLRSMKARPDLAGIPVIYVTGEHDPVVEEKGLSLGAADYVKKPYNVAIIKVKIRNHLDLKDYRDRLQKLVSERTAELQHRTEQLAASREAIIMGMSLLSECHDTVTGEHIERIKAFTALLSNAVHDANPEILTAEMAADIILFSPLHDVGKVSIPDGILKKAGPLTAEEFDKIKAHTTCGADLLRKTEAFYTHDFLGNDLSIAIEIAESHHERFCGGGYPRGLVGQDIPISARIVAIADVYDALRSPRPYKNAISHQAAVDIIVNGDGRTSPDHFDPMVLDVFKKIHPEFETMYRNWHD